MEQAVTVYLRLSDDGWGSSQEREALFDFGEQIQAAIKKAQAGEFDGDMAGEGEWILYLYGPDAEYLFSAVEPLLKSSPLASGGYAIKRYGDAADLDAREVRVEW